MLLWFKQIERHGRAQGASDDDGSDAKKPTESIHLLSTGSYMYSSPFSISRMCLLSSLEKDIRGSVSNSEGSCGKLGAVAARAGGSSMIAGIRFTE